MIKSETHRGFDVISFKDFNGYNCSLQESSSACHNLIWLGCDNTPPRIMACDAKKHNIHTEKTTGWMDYPLPAECIQTNRMHLSRKQVFRLLPNLIKFVILGRI